MRKSVILLLCISILSLSLTAYQTKYVDNGINSSITEAEKGMAGKSVLMSSLSWLMLFSGVASIPVALLVDPHEIGDILLILSLGGWTLTQGFAAFPFKDLEASIKETGSVVPGFGVPMFSHVLSFSLGMGAVTAAGMIFTDDTGTAVTLMAICGVLSWLTGTVANFASYGYYASLSGIPVTSVQNDKYFPNMMNSTYDYNKGLSISIPIYGFIF